MDFREHVTSPGTNREAKDRITVICEGENARAVMEQVKEALIKENRRRASHGETPLAYDVLLSMFTTSMLP